MGKKNHHKPPKQPANEQGETKKDGSKNAIDPVDGETLTSKPLSNSYKMIAGLFAVLAIAIAFYFAPSSTTSREFVNDNEENNKNKLPLEMTMSAADYKKRVKAAKCVDKRSNKECMTLAKGGACQSSPGRFINKKKTKQKQLTLPHRLDDSVLRGDVQPV